MKKECKNFVSKYLSSLSSQEDEDLRKYFVNDKNKIEQFLINVYQKVSNTGLYDLSLDIAFAPQNRWKKLFVSSDGKIHHKDEMLDKALQNFLYKNGKFINLFLVNNALLKNFKPSLNLDTMVFEDNVFVKALIEEQQIILENKSEAFVMNKNNEIVLNKSFNQFLKERFEKFGRKSNSLNLVEVSLFVFNEFEKNKLYLCSNIVPNLDKSVDINCEIKEMADKNIDIKNKDIESKNKNIISQAKKLDCSDDDLSLDEIIKRHNQKLDRELDSKNFEDKIKKNVLKSADGKVTGFSFKIDDNIETVDLTLGYPNWKESDPKEPNDIGALFEKEFKFLLNNPEILGDDKDAFISTLNKSTKSVKSSKAEILSPFKDKHNYYKTDVEYKNKNGSYTRFSLKTLSNAKFLAKLQQNNTIFGLIHFLFKKNVFTFDNGEYLSEYDKLTRNRLIVLLILLSFNDKINLNGLKKLSDNNTPLTTNVPLFKNEIKDSFDIEKNQSLIKKMGLNKKDLDNQSLSFVLENSLKEFVSLPKVKMEILSCLMLEQDKIDFSDVIFYSAYDKATASSVSLDNGSIVTYKNLFNIINDFKSDLFGDALKYKEMIEYLKNNTNQQFNLGILVKYFPEMIDVFSLFLLKCEKDILEYATKGKYNENIKWLVIQLRENKKIHFYNLNDLFNGKCFKGPKNSEFILNSDSVFEFKKYGYELSFENGGVTVNLKHKDYIPSIVINGDLGQMINDYVLDNH